MNCSDRSLKRDIQTVDGALEKVLRLRGTRYTWIETNAPDYGVVAQEVESVVPELVYSIESGKKAVQYNGLNALLIEATKEQQSIIEGQQSQIDALRAEIEAIKASL